MLELLTGVNKREVLKYLGCRGEIGSEYERKIDEGIELVMKAASPKACHTVLKIESFSPLLFEKTEAVFEGEDIKRHLLGCGKCIFMAATLGSGVDSLIRRLSAKDMAEAVICDACASGAIENVCDNYCAALEAEYEKRNLFLTDRFSPGYGDLPLEAQTPLTNILQTQKRIGLCLSRTLALEPTKSVTALVGLCGEKREKRRVCESCERFFDCSFRRRGETCYE